MPKRIEFGGVIHEFPDDFTDDDIAAALGGAETAPKPATEPALISNEDWAKLPLGEKMNRVGTWAARAIGGAFMGPNGVDAANHPGATLGSAALGVAGQYGPSLVAKGLGISSARASQRLADVALKAKDAPVNTKGIGDATLRAIDLGEAGAPVPKVVNKLAKRLTDPSMGDMKYEEARRVYSNLTGLSAKESAKANKPMHRQIVEMRKALHDALVESADTVGMGSQYAKGISEYARAARAAEAGRKVAKYGAGAAGAGIAGHYALDKVLEALSRTSGSR